MKIFPGGDGRLLRGGGVVGGGNGSNGMDEATFSGGVGRTHTPVLRTAE
jgi:hypothetical protein